MTTIHFNTGRKYTVYGQRISATIYRDELVVTFYDHDRMIDGEIEIGSPALWDMNEEQAASLVLRNYDRGSYQSTERSRRDGMYRGGANTTFVGEDA
jgi:hypothetical protein